MGGLQRNAMQCNAMGLGMECWVLTCGVKKESVITSPRGWLVGELLLHYSRGRRPAALGIIFITQGPTAPTHKITKVKVNNNKSESGNKKSKKKRRKSETVKQNRESEN